MTFNRADGKVRSGRAPADARGLFQAGVNFRDNLAVDFENGHTRGTGLHDRKAVTILVPFECSTRPLGQGKIMHNFSEFIVDMYHFVAATRCEEPAAFVPRHHNSACRVLPGIYAEQSLRHVGQLANTRVQEKRRAKTASVI